MAQGDAEAGAARSDCGLAQPPKVQCCGTPCTCGQAETILLDVEASELDFWELMLTMTGFIVCGRVFAAKILKMGSCWK